MSDHLFDLSGKVAVVTGAGANGGIGHALALGFARHGADIVVADIDDEGARITGEEIENLGRQTLVAHCDISDPADVEELFAAADEYFGQIDILANVPFAFPERVRPHELSLEAWEKTLAVGLTGYFLCAQQALRCMIDHNAGGCILNIGSIAGTSGVGRGNFPYSTSKGGVVQMTRELATKEGLLLGISSGANVAAALSLANQARYQNKRFVVILCDIGDRYLSTPTFRK